MWESEMKVADLWNQPSVSKVYPADNLEDTQAIIRPKPIYNLDFYNSSTNEKRVKKVSVTS